MKSQYQDHIDAGHFNIVSRYWMGGKLIWFWQKGSDPNARYEGPFEKQSEAGEAAISWYESTLV